MQPTSPSRHSVRKLYIKEKHISHHILSESDLEDGEQKFNILFNYLNLSYAHAILEREKKKSSTHFQDYIIRQFFDKENEKEYHRFEANRTSDDSWHVIQSSCFKKRRVWFQKKISTTSGKRGGVMNKMSSQFFLYSGHSHLIDKI